MLEMGQVLTTSKFPGDTSRVCRNGHIRSAAGEGPRFLWYVLQISRMTFALSTFHKPPLLPAETGAAANCPRAAHARLYLNAQKRMHNKLDDVARRGQLRGQLWLRSLCVSRPLLCQVANIVLHINLARFALVVSVRGARAPLMTRELM